MGGGLPFRVRVCDLLVGWLGIVPVGWVSGG